MKPQAHICSSCGQVVIPEGLALTPTQNRILEAVRQRPGISAEALRTRVWMHDPSGGPEDPKVLHVHVHHLNARLAVYGVAVRGGSGGYRVVLC